MNKEDLVSEVAKVVATKKEAEAVVDTVFGAITRALKEGDRVNLAGFGTFTVSGQPSMAISCYLKVYPRPSRQALIARK